MKVALVLQKVADEEKIDVSDEEAKAEIQKQAEYYKDAEKRVAVPVFVIKGRMRNTKTTENFVN